MRMGTAIPAMVLFGLFPATAARAQLCPMDTLSGSFRSTVLTGASDSLDEPMHLDFDPSAKGGPDLYFVERGGLVRRSRAPHVRVETLGRIPVRSFGEQGLLGIALDPDFGNNRRIFLSYIAANNSNDFRVSRITLKDDSLDPASERILLHFPFSGSIYHSGALLFDPSGNLFIAIGNGESDPVQGKQWISADSRDFRGKILRIRPTEDGYAIPVGNLFPLDKYPDIAGSKTRPEIYAMGVKQPFSLGFDSGSGRLVFGEMGPDNGGLADELNLAAGPGNFGWPYFYGANTPFDVWGIGKDPEHPVNPSPLSGGLTDLPPALPATRSIKQNAPITGPVYRFAVARPGPERMPPAFDGLWFSTDFNTGFVDTARVLAGGAIGPSGPISLPKLWHPIDLRAGPDGALYAINYGGWNSRTYRTAILRIGWDSPCATGVVTASRAADAPSRGWDGWGARVPKGPHEVEYRDVTGKLRWGRSGR